MFRYPKFLQLCHVYVAMVFWHGITYAWPGRSRLGDFFPGPLRAAHAAMSRNSRNLWHTLNFASIQFPDLQTTVNLASDCLSMTSGPPAPIPDGLWTGYWHVLHHPFCCGCCSPHMLLGWRHIGRWATPWLFVPKWKGYTWVNCSL